MLKEEIALAELNQLSDMEKMKLLILAQSQMMVDAELYIRRLLEANNVLRKEINKVTGSEFQEFDDIASQNFNDINNRSLDLGWTIRLLIANLPRTDGSKSPYRC